MADVLPTPGPVAAGQICDPANLPDPPPAGLACQLTDETNDYQIPGQFLNALKGDIVLSPADGEVIGALLMSLSPSQFHSHSGIMTLNFGQITHCTASEERLGAYRAMNLAVPYKLEPEQLKYLWPGSITQSVDAAVNGELWRDPQMPAKTYLIQGFLPQDQDTWDGGKFVLIPPLVVKPLPENEATTRAKLEQAADIALGKGATIDANGSFVKSPGCYYSFYAYTKPEDSAGFANAAGADAHWAQGASGAVCSSFVWLCVKTAGIPCVTTNQFEIATDFRPDAIANGALASGATLDGLFFYPGAERKVSGAFLFERLREMVLEMDPAASLADSGTTSNLGDSYADAYATQIANDFAFGDPDRPQTADWQNPGDANAVSPDNILMWNSPYFGCAEPLQYLPAHVEQYTLSRWKAVNQYGDLNGSVTVDGAPAASARVMVGGETVYADQGGHYSLLHLAYGDYDLTASVTENGFYFSNGAFGQVATIGASEQTIDVAIQTTSADFRTIQVMLFETCGHWDQNPGFHAQNTQSDGPVSISVNLSPWQLTAQSSYDYSYDNGGYFVVQYAILFSLKSDLSVDIQINTQMFNADNDSGQPNKTGDPLYFNVAPDGSQHAFTTTTTDSTYWYTNGPAKLTGVVTNTTS
jgi:hypothetical protein